MLYYKNYTEHTFKNSKQTEKHESCDQTIYAFDIETTSFLINTKTGKQYPACQWRSFSKKEQNNLDCIGTMYIWQLSVNDTVYFGRTWNELAEFFQMLENNNPIKKIIHVHNLSFEMQYLLSNFKFDSVFARKERKPIFARMKDYHIEFRCTLMMTNCGLAKLPEIYKLPVEKKVGDLDYTLLRHSKTALSTKELSYCEYDCLVLYYYIKSQLEIYKKIESIPLTLTGRVRRELKSKVYYDYNYRREVKKAINKDPIIYNRLLAAFAGGYTHASWLYSCQDIREPVESYDFSSSYPYVMITHKFPMSKFKPCTLKSLKDMKTDFNYLLKIRLFPAKGKEKVISKYINTFISSNKCDDIYNGSYDNGRILSCDELTITCTDVDAKLYTDVYECEYEILESYYAVSKYLPIQFVKFILEKYKKKTELKGVKGKEIEYSLEKNKYNSLYGMSVTNTIRDEILLTEDGEWKPDKLTNAQIIEKLEKEEKEGFLSFAWGVWITAYARNNLLRIVMKCDDCVIYCDTDSLKVIKSMFDINIINSYNEFVRKKIERVCAERGLNFSDFEPSDINGEKHRIGVFENDFHYEEFKTLGAKKYIVKEDGEIHITVSGVPKKAKEVFTDISQFQDKFIFRHEDTNKNVLTYNDNQDTYLLTDYQGITIPIQDKRGVCVMPVDYQLGCYEYQEFASSQRSKYREYA